MVETCWLQLVLSVSLRNMQQFNYLIKLYSVGEWKKFAIHLLKLHQSALDEIYIFKKCPGFPAMVFVPHFGAYGLSFSKAPSSFSVIWSLGIGLQPDNIWHTMRLTIRNKFDCSVQAMYWNWIELDWSGTRINHKLLVFMWHESTAFNRVEQRYGYAY